MHEKGFTFLELLIVVGLLAVFTILTIPYGVDFFRSRLLDEEIKAVSEILKRAQAHAISGKDDSDWGVKFFQDEGKYEIFRGSGCEEREIYQTINLSKGIEMEGIDCIIFERNTGEPQIVIED
jgi:prepilin-type N-terminal cleavage/methylation domain-containing protein